MQKKYFLVPLVALAGLTVAYFTFKFISQHKARNLEQISEFIAEDSIVIEMPSPQLLFGIAIDSLEVFEGAIKRNENLGDILMDYNVSAKQLFEISQLPKEVFNVRKLKSNKPYTIIHDRDSLKTAKHFIYHPNLVDYVILSFSDSISAQSGQHEVDTVEQVLTGIIAYSLYQSVVDSGRSPLLVNKMADVYAWEIDFFGIQKNDAFKIIYETYEVNGERAGIGEIKASYFKHMDEDFYAFQYDQGEGKEYFDETGASLRKTFLKAPLNFTRISSRFSYSRLHPILKIRRPHLGVDYAAPKGTPVVSVGDGLVIKAAYSGGAGNMVKIKHNGNYTTAYLHLWKYGEGIRKGERVKQGQVIGYVGNTGLSTGPHLDFRFYKNGKAVDPLSIDPPSASPIKDEEMTDFNIVSSKWKIRLDSIETPVSDDGETLLTEAR